MEICDKMGQKVLKGKARDAVSVLFISAAR